MKIYRFVHLSDIHFGQERDGQVEFHNDVRERLLDDCAFMQRRIGPSNSVIVTGDIAYSGKETEYDTATLWLHRLTEAAKCHQAEVRVIPGNHDVDFDEIDHTSELWHVTLRAGSPTQAHADLEVLARENPNGHPLFRKLSAYNKFAHMYGCDFPSTSKPCWEKFFQLEHSCRIRLIGLTGTQVSNKQDAKGNLILGKAQCIIPQPNDSTQNIVLLHHRPEWFKDQRDVETYLHNRARVLLYGHEHLPRIETTRDANDNERLVIDAGAVNPPEEDGSYVYTYNWLEFSTRMERGTVLLTVRVYPRVWLANQTKFEADKTRMPLDENESKEFRLACPQIKPRSEQPKPGGPGIEAGTPTNTPEEDWEAVTQEQEARFARLRYFFWRYLNWRQRLQVLVRLDVLPETIEKPLPQTLERLALERAKSKKVLGKLWTAVMELVPESDRETNPYEKGEGG